MHTLTLYLVTEVAIYVELKHSSYPETETSEIHLQALASLILSWLTLLSYSAKAYQTNRSLCDKSTKILHIAIHHYTMNIFRY